MKWLLPLSIVLLVAIAAIIATISVSQFNLGKSLGRIPGDFLGQLGCSIRGEACGKLPEELMWAENRAHPKECNTLKGTRIWHVRCEDESGQYSTNCNDYIPEGTLLKDAKFKGKPLESSPIRAPKQDPGWTQIEIADEACTVDWNSAGAHDKNWCADGGRVYHVRCELPDGSPSLHCKDVKGVPKGDLGGNPIIGNAKILEDPAWAEVVVKDPRCRVSWNEQGAHRKECVGGVQTYHVRCERSNGQWDTACLSMQPGGIFKGKPVVGNPRRLPDKAWTEVKIRGCQ